MRFTIEMEPDTRYDADRRHSVAEENSYTVKATGLTEVEGLRVLAYVVLLRGGQLPVPAGRTTEQES